MSDPRIDPRMTEAARSLLIDVIGCSCPDGERDVFCEFHVVEPILPDLLTAALRAAREAGADAVAVDGGLVRVSQPNDLGQRFVVPLDGGDDGA